MRERRHQAVLGAVLGDVAHAELDDLAGAGRVTSWPSISTVPADLGRACP